MKIIKSNGGPFIAVHRQDLAQWSGIDGLTFFDKHPSIETDYDGICEADAGLSAFHDVIGRVRGAEIETIMLAVPLPTLMVEATNDHVYLAQIETSEVGWSEAELRSSDFEAPAEWIDPLYVSFKAGEIILFDSASSTSMLRECEVLRIPVEGGRYVCEWSSQFWEGKARMNFVRMVRET